MEDEKLQRLHDTLEKLRPKGKTGGLGFGSAWGGVPGKPVDDLPKNGLYSYFVRSGQTGYKKWTEDDDGTEEQEPHPVSGPDGGEKESKKKKKSKKKKREEEEEDDEVGSKSQRKDKKKSKKARVEQESTPKDAESEIVEAERHDDNTRKKKRSRYSEAEEGKEPVPVENKVEKEGKKRRKSEGKEEVVITAEQVETYDVEVSDLTTGGFEWHKHIKKVLKKAEGRRMCFKALRKEVVILARRHHEEALGTAPDKKALKTVFKQIVGSTETLIVEDGHVVYSRRRSVEQTTSMQDTERVEEGPVEEATEDLVEGGEKGSKKKKKKRKAREAGEQAEE